MSKTCQQCLTQFELTPTDQAFYQNRDIPEPKLCAACRRVRRWAFVNTFTLYPSHCAQTGVAMLSMYHPTHSPIKALSHDAYWSDQWDPYDYGIDFDWSRPFFEQFQELSLRVPRQACDVDTSTLVNSDYSNMCGNLKDSYLSFRADLNERCLFTSMSNKCRDVVNAEGCYDCELCYGCTRCENCYHSKYLVQCINCLNALFCYDCSNLQDCFGCYNLKNKQYCIYNEQKTAKEYAEFIAALPLGSRAGLKKIQAEVTARVKGRNVRVYFGIKNESVTGNYLTESHHAEACFDARGVENSKDCDHITLGRIKDCRDYYLWGNQSELMVEAVICGEGAYNVKFCLQCWPACSNLEYCISCHSSDSCFASVGIKKGRYVILNKQYTADQYVELKARLIDHMKQTGEYGEFFPITMSPYAYNESDAGIEYAPLSQDAVLQRGWRWENELPGTFGKQTTAQASIPDAIHDCTETLSKEILECSLCKKNYKVLKQEILYYKKMNIPIPELCWLCSLQEHFKKLPGYTLYNRPCGRCKKTITTPYAESRAERVLCEECYQLELHA